MVTFSGKYDRGRENHRTKKTISEILALMSEKITMSSKMNGCLNK